ncbi:hydrogenase 4 subunit B [Candidatus Kaiserbacteria bacterium]|nr:hydrogenase 4 subunit B [Candidatus Kaiserbacteria bacterium]
MIDFILQYGLIASFSTFALGAILSLVLASRTHEEIASALAHAFAGVGSLMALLFGITALAASSTITAAVGSIGILQTAFSVRVDPLAAFFISTIAIIALAASVYGASYQRQFLGKYGLGPFGFFYNIFIASMLAVVVADNGLFFLVAWEIMTAVSYFLVIFEWRERQNVSAGLLYILVSQLGAAFLLAAILLLHNATGSWEFGAMRDIGGVPGISGILLLAFALVGLSTKAGVIPLHIWLPEAHPAAPSHVSALMSSVMIKTAVFMMIRFFIEFFPADPTWGLIILGLGAVSCLLGVLYALSEHDIKRLLAFHSVENIGIILLGLGSAIVFFGYGADLAGVVALAASLYHTVNHALFKSLLFLSAGSVVHATGTRNMEEYGGLIKKMPYTAFFFLIGAVAISGLPPFNGFVSEWLTFQGLFIGIGALPISIKIVFLAGAAALALTGGLAAACFVKAFGATFLARPRGDTGERAHESGFLMTVPMAFIALLTLLFGVAASSVTSVVAHIAASLKGLAEGPIAVANPLYPITVDDFSSLAMIGVSLTIAVAIGGVYVAVSLAAGKKKIVLSRTWNCGAPLSPRMEITATAFSRSIITVFAGLLRPSIQKDAEYHDASMRYFAKSHIVRLSVPNLYRAYIYDPTVLLIEKGALRVRKIQTGNLNMYLLYIFLTVAALLWWALR